MEDPDDLYTVEMLSQLRRSDDLKSFFWFAGEFVQCVAGTRTWGNEKYLATLTGAMNTETNIPVVTTSDEAMALLLFENYRDKWIRQFKEKARGEKPGRIDGKYTSSIVGHGEYAGWSKDGLAKYTSYCKLVKLDRLCDTAKTAEEGMLAFYRESVEGKRRWKSHNDRQRQQENEETEEVETWCEWFC